jgi:DNA mismatch endonuclease (patch repair protein)
MASGARRFKRKPMTRSQVMARIRSIDTKPERAVRAEVRSLGQFYRKNVRTLPGAPDLANKSRKWAIFVHGCFWHTHSGCPRSSTPKSNTSYWEPKLARNKIRDADNIKALNAFGFRTLIIWECITENPPLLKKALTAFFDAL